MRRTSSKDKLEKLEELGHGGFATVYKAIWKTGKYVAVKEISKSKLRGNESRVLQEIGIHKTLSHPSIVKFEGWYEDAESYNLILEYCNRGTLEELWKKRKRVLSESEAHDIIREVVKGIVYLHKKFILHRDITLRNILFTKCSCGSHKSVKIADFGMAVKQQENDVHRTVVGTPNFMPPEMLKREDQSDKCDIWSLGCVLYALLVGKHPFEAERTEKVYNNALNVTPKIPHSISEDARFLIEDLLNKDPNQRPSIFDLFNKYRFFRKYASRLECNFYECKPDQYRSGDSGKGYSLSSASRSHGTFDSDLNSAHSYKREQFYQSTSELKWAPATIKAKDTHRKSQSAERPAVLENLKNRLPLLPTRRIPFSNKEHSQERLKQNCQLDYCFHPDSQEQIRIRDQFSSDERHYCSNPCLENENVLPVNSRHCYSDEEYQGKCQKQFCKSDHAPFQRKRNHVGPLSPSCSHDEYCYQDKNNCSHERTCGCQNDAGRLSPSCSHDRYCYQEKYNCSHEITCSCQHHSTQNSHLSHDPSNNYEGVNKYELKPYVKRNIKQDITPLNTVRLPSKRFEIEKKDMVLTISKDGQVFLECFKLKKRQKRINLLFCISSDGMKISICKPEKCFIGDQPPPLTSEIELYTLETLPETHRKKYICAQRTISIVRSKTTKITIFGKQAKCEMRENLPDPDFHVFFYNGYKITKVADRISFTDKYGQRINHHNDMPENCKHMWEIYEEMQKQCKDLENKLTSYEISCVGLETSIFPATFGKQPPSLGILQSLNKENVSPHSVSVPFNGHSMNSTQRTPSSHNSKCYKSFFDLKKEIPKLKGCPEFKNENIIVEYEDGIQIWSSKTAKKIILYDKNGKRIEDFCKNPDLKKRVAHDFKEIVKYMIDSKKIT